MYDEEDESRGKSTLLSYFPDADLPKPVSKLSFSEVLSFRQIYSIKEDRCLLQGVLVGHWLEVKYIDDTICEKGEQKIAHLFLHADSKDRRYGHQLEVSCLSCYRDVRRVFHSDLQRYFFDFLLPDLAQGAFSNIERDYSLLEQVNPSNDRTKGPLPETSRSCPSSATSCQDFQKAKPFFNEKVLHTLWKLKASFSKTKNGRNSMLFFRKVLSI
jgi:hypothetical protein